jgi:hypothetical protein
LVEDSLENGKGPGNPACRHTDAQALGVGISSVPSFPGIEQSVGWQGQGNLPMKTAVQRRRVRLLGNTPMNG